VAGSSNAGLIKHLFRFGHATPVTRARLPYHRWIPASEALKKAVNSLNGRETSPTDLNDFELDAFDPASGPAENRADVECAPTAAIPEPLGDVTRGLPHTEEFLVIDVDQASVV
jgi:hypothetical protein